MKTTNYRLQTEIEHLTPASQKEWFKDHLKAILECNEPHFAKCDHIALSFIELDHKIAYLTDEIKALTALKKKLQQAKTLGLEITAQTLQAYGIDKIEGTAVSSLTVAPPKTKIKEMFHITNPEKVMELGYVKFEVDEESVKEAMHHTEMFAALDPYVEVSYQEEEVPARLKINKRRSTATPPATEPAELLDAA